MKKILFIFAFAFLFLMNFQVAKASCDCVCTAGSGQVSLGNLPNASTCSSQCSTSFEAGIGSCRSASGHETVTFLNETIETDSLNGFMQIAIAISKWILSIVGSIALLMFVYGGFVFLMSGGSSEKVSQGKNILIQSIIALVIIFASYTIIGFIFSTLGISGWSSSSWFNK